MSLPHGSYTDKWIIGPNLTCTSCDPCDLRQAALAAGADGHIVGLGGDAARHLT